MNPSQVLDFIVRLSPLIQAFTGLTLLGVIINQVRINRQQRETSDMLLLQNLNEEQRIYKEKMQTLIKEHESIEPTSEIADKQQRQLDAARDILEELEKFDRLATASKIIYRDRHFRNLLNSLTPAEKEKFRNYIINGTGYEDLFDFGDLYRE